MPGIIDLYQQIGVRTNNPLPDIQYASQKFENVTYGPVEYGPTVPVVVVTSEFTNDTDAPSNQTFTSTDTVALTHSWQTTRGVSMAGSVGISISGLSAQVSTTMTFSDTTGKQETATHSFGGSASITIPARSKVLVTLVLNEVEYKARLSGTKIVNGTVHVDFPFGYVTVGIGKVFASHPHPEIEVVDDYSLRFKVEANYVAVEGKQWIINTKQFKIDAQASESPMADVQLLHMPV